MNNLAGTLEGRVQPRLDRLEQSVSMLGQHVSRVFGSRGSSWMRGSSFRVRFGSKGSSWTTYFACSAEDLDTGSSLVNPHHRLDREVRIERCKTPRWTPGETTARDSSLGRSGHSTQLGGLPRARGGLLTLPCMSCILSDRATSGARPCH